MNWNSETVSQKDISNHRLITSALLSHHQKKWGKFLWAQVWKILLRCATKKRRRKLYKFELSKSKTSILKNICWKYMPNTGRTYLKIISDFKKELIERITKKTYLRHIPMMGEQKFELVLHHKISKGCRWIIEIIFSLSLLVIG